MENEFNFDFDLSKIAASLPSFEAPKLPSFEIPDINTMLEDSIESIYHVKSETLRREIENNESLKALVDYNEDISRYNKELVSLNEKILNKINSLDDTLTFLNRAFSNKVDKDNDNSDKQLTLLVELITIIEDKDSSKLELFMTNVGAPLGVGLLIEALKIKFGLG